MPKMVERRTGLLAPVFPNYLFVRHPEGLWYYLTGTPGVIGCILDAGKPARLTKKDMTKLQALEVDGIIEFPEEPYRAGQKIRVKRGSLQDHLGMYIGMTRRNRIAALFDLLGQKVRVEIDESDVTAA